MSNAITCPSCAARFALAEDARGQRLFCPRCGRPLAVAGGATRLGEGAPPGRGFPWPWLTAALLVLLAAAVGLAVYALTRPGPQPGGPVAANTDGAADRDGARDKLSPLRPADSGTPPKPPPNTDPTPGSKGDGAEFLLPLDALGKPERLAEVKGVQLECVFHYPPGKQADTPATLTWDPAGRWRLSGRIPDRVSAFDILYDGDHTWLRIQLDPALLKGADPKNAAMAEPLFDGAWHSIGDAVRSENDLISLSELAAQGRSIPLPVLGEGKVNGRPCVIVQAAWAGGWLKDAKAYFDRDTHLLAKIEYRGNLTATYGGAVEKTGDSLWEIYFSDYQEADGVKHWRKVEWRRDGVLTESGEVKAVRYLRTVDDALFRAS
jgi:hypothetical protein